MPPVLALGAVGLLAMGAYRIFASVREDHAKQVAFRAANGWSIDEIVSELIDGFDQDGDGRIAFDVVQGARMVAESQRTKLVKQWSEPLRAFGIPTGATAVRERYVTSTIEPTLRKADADHDGVATRAEIQVLLRAFDVDGNGRLSKVEKSAALAALGSVRLGTTEKTVGVLPPPPNPAPAR